MGELKDSPSKGDMIETSENCACAKACPGKKKQKTRQIKNPAIAPYTYFLEKMPKKELKKVFILILDVLIVIVFGISRLPKDCITEEASS